MGIIADIEATEVSFTNPKNSDPMDAINNRFSCVQHAFEMTFALKFDANKGIGPVRGGTEDWQIGIVQNALFQRYSFEYEGGLRFTKEFPGAAVDSGSTKSFPFYNDPVAVSACKLDPVLNCKKMIPIMTPVATVTITPQGYSDKPVPTSGSISKNSPDSLNIIDEPYFGARLFLKNGALILEAETIIAFQAWLVAQRDGHTHVLSTILPFSLAFWLKTTPAKGSSGIYVPPYKFSFYGQNGVHHKVRYDDSGPQASVGSALGDGGRKPVMTGQTAGDRANDWVVSKELVP